MTDKKAKLNDKHDKKVKKNNKLKTERYISDEAREVRRFVIILFSIIILVLVVYGVTRLLKKDTNNQTDNTVTAGSIDYDKVSVGTMFNRDIKEYYVMLYDGEDSNAMLYSAIINKYMSSEKALKIYYCDLGNKLNSDYKITDSETSNPSASNINDVKFGDLTLVKIKNGKITKYIENIDTIKSELGI